MRLATIPCFGNESVLNTRAFHSEAPSETMASRFHSQADVIRALSRHDGQMATLRDRCSLQTESKTPQIIGVPLFAGAFESEPHCVDEFGTRHTDAVVPHGNPRFAIVPEETDRDSLSLRGDTIVDDICERSIESVADAAERLEER